MFELFRKQVVKILEICESAVKIAGDHGENKVALGQLINIREKANNPQLALTVVGRVGTGKSTLINALLGRELLPWHDLPCTRCDVRISYGAGESALVDEGSEGRVKVIDIGQFAEYIAVDGAHEARSAEIKVKSDLLKDGLQIIDTPGFDDVNELRSTVVQTVLPESDLVLIVLDIEGGGIGRTEKEFLETYVFPSHNRNLLFVLNKIDHLTSPEDIGTLCGYISEKVQDFEDIPHIIPVAAKTALRQILADGKADDETGIPRLKSEIERIIANETTEIVGQTIIQNTVDMMAGIENALEIQKQNIAADTEELNNKVQTLTGERELLQAELQAKVNEAADQIENIMQNFRRRLDDFTSRFEQHLRDEILILPTGDFKNQERLCTALGASIKKAYQVYLEKEAPGIVEEIEELGKNMSDEMHRIAQQVDLRGVGVSQMNLPQALDYERYIMPGLLAGGFLFLGLGNFILLALVSSVAGEPIKNTIVDIISNTGPLKSKFADRVCDQLSDIASNVYVSFAKNLKGEFMNKANQSLSNYKAQMEQVEESLAALISKRNQEDEQSIDLLTAIEADIVNLNELKTELPNF